MNDFEQRERLGYTSKAPRWVVAYKFAAEQGLTRLLDIEVQVGKTGTLTPIAMLDPVQLAGTTVKRASLHNADEIARKDIRIGDMVVVEKAGEIIPYIVRAEHSARTGAEKVFQFPTCPLRAAQSADEKGAFVHGWLRRSREAATAAFWRNAPPDASKAWAPNWSSNSWTRDSCVPFPIFTAQ